ncbi:MAG: M24 family metallopeptidase [Acidimicrobiia bacterium]
MTARIRGTRALDLADNDALLVTAREDVRWISGFTGSHGWLLVDRESIVLLTDGRYMDQARAEVGGEVRVRICRTTGEMVGAVRDTFMNGFAAQDEALDVATWKRITRSIGRVPEAAAPGLTDLRRTKDEGEASVIARAADIASVALGDCLELVAPGVTERRLRDALEARMRELGADGPSYDTIVATGPSNSARPHHHPTDRPIIIGDSVVIDVGALVDGYHSDMTRTFFVGDPDPELLAWYDALSVAQQAAIDTVAPGRAVSEVDEAARRVLRERGVERWFTHGLGHGVGLLIHENPFIRSTSDAVLRPGDVVTIEPGLYRDGLGGIRIEDLLLVTETAAVNLTKAPKDPTCPR